MKKTVVVVHCIGRSAASAGQRINGIVEYLREFGYSVVVVESNDAPSLDYHRMEDVTIISNSAFGFLAPFNFSRRSPAFVHKLKALYNKGLQFLLSDINSRWTARAISILEKIVSEKQVDFIISSYAPVGPHLVALEIKRRFPHLVWIADMRDEMAKAPSLTFLERWRLEKVEREIVRAADAVTSVSEPLLAQFGRHAPSQTVFREIRNGYNYEPTLLGAPVRHNDGVFRIRYLGSFYGARSPEHFLKALEGIASEVPLAKVEFIGSSKNYAVPKNLTSMVDFVDKVAYKETLVLMQGANALLLILPENSQQGVYSGKIFEYLASGTPIIGLVPPNDVAGTLIREARGGEVVSNDDIRGIQDCILRAYGRWESGERLNIDQEVVRAHHRREQVRRLSVLMEELATNRSS